MTNDQAKQARKDNLQRIYSDLTLAFDEAPTDSQEENELNEALDHIIAAVKSIE